jgi:hypothetical protein
MTLRDPEPLYSKAMEMPHLTMLVSEHDHMDRPDRLSYITRIHKKMVKTPYQVHSRGERSMP